MPKASTHSTKRHRPPRNGGMGAAMRTGKAPENAPAVLENPEPLSALERQELRDLRDTVATLYAREALLEAVIQSLPIWVTVKDFDGRHLMVNEAAAKAFGKTPAEFVGKKSAEVLPLPKGEIADIDTLDNMVLRSDKPVERPSYVVTLPDGTEQVRRMIKLPLHDSDGATLGIISWSEDITQRMEVEATLDRNRRLLQTVFNTIPHPTSFTDFERRLRMVNTAFCESLRVKPEDVLGKTVMEVPNIPKRIRQALWDQTTEIYEKGVVTPPKDYVYPLPDGGSVMTQTSKAPMYVNGKLEGIVTLSVDVTELRQANLRLAESRQLLQTLFDVMPHPLSYVDRTRKLHMVNSAWCAALDVTPEEVLGKTILEVEAIPENVRKTLWDESTEVFKTGVVPAPLVHKIPRKNGTVRYAQVGKSAVLVNGQVDGIVTLSTDITPIRLAEEQAELAEQRMT
ncbi:MAG TPA: PAS domain-containing protein, partial [bacterium]